MKKDLKNKVVSGWYVACVGGGGYLTATSYLGGCGTADVDFVIMDVDVKVGESINIEDSNDKAFESKLANHVKNNNMIFAKKGFICDCGGGRVYCNSDIGDCEGICAEAEEIREKLK